MKDYGKRRAPWVLMAVGMIMALWGLLALGQTRDVLQYCIVAPASGERDTALQQLIERQETACEEIEEGIRAAAINGIRNQASASASNNSGESAVYAIGEGWFEVYTCAIGQGRRISEAELADGTPVAMLDEGLAFELFGSELPENAQIELEGSAYRVIGTVRHARGVGDVQEHDIYIPLKAAAANGMQLDVMMVSALPLGQSGAARFFEEAMREQWQDGGTMINLSKEAMRRTIIVRVILLIVGLYCLIGLFRRMSLVSGRWFAGFREALKWRYFRQLVPKLAGILVLSALGFAALIALIWLLMDFSVRPLYVFTEWVPENIVEWSSIRTVFWSLVGESAKLVKVGSRELRTVEFWGGILRWGAILALLGAAIRRRRAADGKNG